MMTDRNWQEVGVSSNVASSECSTRERMKSLLALVDINPVGAEGGLCLELSSGSKQAHLAKGLTLKEIPGTTKARRAPF